MKSVALFVGILATAVVSSVPATDDADETDDDTVTIYETATVRERPVASATATVTVVERGEIEASGATALMEILPFVPGVTLVSGATRGGLTNAQIRGGDPNFTRVLVDGVPLNDGTYQVGGVFNLEALPADAVERVEVVRGPFSSHYGSTGLAGAIQLLTRRGDGPPSGALEVGAGDASYRRAGASLGAGRDDGGDVFFHLLGEEEAERIVEERFELLHAQGRGTVVWSERSSLRLAGRLARWEGDDYPDASGGPVFGTGELRTAQNEEASLSARWSRTADRRLDRLELVGYRHDLDRESPAIGFLVPASVESTEFTRAVLRGATSLPLEWSGTDVQLSVGADVEHEDGRNESLLLLPDFLGGPVAGDYDLERTTPGVYTELVARRERLTVELGVRADFPDSASEELSPRLGLAWEAGPSTRIRASVGRAFKLPSYFALASPPALGGNPDLRPETVVGGDVGISHRWDALGLDADLTVFAQRFEDLVDFDFATFLHVNRSEVDAHGVEASLSRRGAGPWSAAANVTWQDVEDVATGAPLRHRPEWSGGVRVGWQGADLSLQGDVRFASSSVDEQIPVPELTRVDGYALLGLAVRWGATTRLDVLGRFDNLTDEDYETLVGFPGAGPSARLHLRLRLGG